MKNGLKYLSWLMVICGLIFFVFIIPYIAFIR